jgi:hypothetical protein
VRGAREIRGLAKNTLEVHADVRRELAADFVAQSQPDFCGGQPRADVIVRIVSTEPMNSQFRLKEQPLRNAHVVVGRKTRGGAT